MTQEEKGRVFSFKKGFEPVSWEDAQEKLGLSLEMEKILHLTQGRKIGGDGNPSLFPWQISTDTRTLKRGDLFFALRGERFDGHWFIEEAFQKGALGAVISHSPKISFPSHFFLILVRDTLKALQNIASFHRRRFFFPFVGITGSNGKTTVKEMLWHILSSRGEVLKSPGNFNNQVGLPLSLLRLSYHHWAAVLELGTNREGEIENLSRILLPTLGVITNTGTAHIGLLGGREGILRAKSELIKILNQNPDNTLLLNEDDEGTPYFKKIAHCKVLGFGINTPSSFYGSRITCEEKIKFVFGFPGGEIKINLPFPGIHQVYNALCASSCAFLLGIEPEVIRERLISFKPLPLRGEILEWKGAKLVNDCYNANPTSMERALSFLKTLRAKRRIAILGDMLELGKMSEFYHYQVGKEVSSWGIDILLTLGEKSLEIARGAKEGGMKEVYSFREKEDLTDFLASLLREGDAALIKGSRKMEMESIPRMLKEKYGS